MKEAEELVEAIPYASLRIILDCGHMIPLEQPRELARIIVEWIPLKLFVYPAKRFTSSG
jgi:pimeloyl-ACP methyl ester carboxylesterase